MKPRALPALSFSRRRLRRGAGQFQPGLCAAPTAPGPACSPPEAWLCRDPRAQPGRPGGQDSCRQDKGGLLLVLQPGKGVPAPAVTASGPGEEKWIHRRAWSGGAGCVQPQSPLVLPAALQTSPRAACSSHQTEKGKKKWASKVYFSPFGSFQLVGVSRRQEWEEWNDPLSVEGDTFCTTSTEPYTWRKNLLWSCSPVLTIINWLIFQATLRLLSETQASRTYCFRQKKSVKKYFPKNNNNNNNNYLYFFFFLI